MAMRTRGSFQGSVLWLLRPKRMRRNVVVRDGVGDDDGPGRVLGQQQHVAGRGREVDDVAADELGVAVGVLRDDRRVPAVDERLAAPVLGVLAVLHRDRAAGACRGSCSRCRWPALSSEGLVGVQLLRHDREGDSARTRCGYQAARRGTSASRPCGARPGTRPCRGSSISGTRWGLTARKRSRLVLQSSMSMTRPLTGATLCHFTSGRSVKVTVMPSGEISIASASTGTGYCRLARRRVDAGAAVAAHQVLVHVAGERHLEGAMSHRVVVAGLVRRCETPR